MSEIKVAGFSQPKQMRTTSQYERLPVDPRIVRQVQGDSRMSREQGPGFMQRWGGAQNYMQASSMPVNQRVVYMAIGEGFVSPDAIIVATGLGVRDVNKALEELERLGYVETGVVSK